MGASLPDTVDFIEGADTEGRILVGRGELLTALRRVTDLEGVRAELLDEVLDGPVVTPLRRTTGSMSSLDGD
ncbi:hypothetical protein [Streptomonospora salina]|uniref:Uncharacterized protein n=1 Tax=Streptomonospora salina TaxID=104205 RepID=A0A841EA71_9ACTN|nr:hypothetical protein [Streptomonospora salina]MBB5999906.1 hypothetical protein [Streptomonospora salina]